MSKLYVVVFFIVVFIFEKNQSHEVRRDDVVELVKYWSIEIGKELEKLTQTMTRKDKVQKSFDRLRTKVYNYEEGQLMSDKIARDLRDIMDKKSEAVHRISRYAEQLSANRPDDPLFQNGSYHYFNADNFTDNSMNLSKINELEDYRHETECEWYCKQKDTIPKENLFEFLSLFKQRADDQLNDQCDCKYLLDRLQPLDFYKTMPLEYDSHFGEKVNTNFSVVKTATEIYEREQNILEGVRWSEPLDLIFKKNYEKDPTLTWQYFASPKGYMRHYPAIRWSDEPYDRTYDMRTRSWYTEAMTSPKDIVILVDRSGSMKGKNRKLSAHIVNEILDTLNDNDFVNVYVFTNTTEPLVPCFKDTLVQANEENLRLLRENLTMYSLEFAADISLGLSVAFEILENFRDSNKSSNCNQAIMLITEGVDYYYDTEMIERLNKKKNYPVRIFTYQLGTSKRDQVEMQSIACSNMGYFANVSTMQDVRDKMLNYLTVMSRPINFAYHDKQNPIWSYLYVDLADRRLSNWLWTKFEGIRQREVFLDHGKRVYQSLNQMITSPKSSLLKDEHDYTVYESPHKYNYMTTVSYPVYATRESEFELIGVAGVDVPIDLLKSLIPHALLGVNGYAFIVTNNGYLLMHPDHQKTFENDKILKPTFNRVDLLEVEILDDDSEPRLFNKSIVELRKKIVDKGKGAASFQVKIPIDNLKRVLLSTRHYFYSDIGPFGFSIVLPDLYGLTKIDDSDVEFQNWKNSLLRTNDWKVHPEWKYCSNCGNGKTEDKIKRCLNMGKRCVFNDKSNKNSLYATYEEVFKGLLKDAELTKWFPEKIPNEDRDFISKYLVSKIFIATRSGLTRWRTFKRNEDSDESNDFEIMYPNAIDEDWYQRAVEMNFENKEENTFIYSVPFEISGYENNTMIMATNAIFVRNETKKTPVATIGLLFNHNAMSNLYDRITQCTGENHSKCKLRCKSNDLECFILDNNAYVVLSDEIEYTGRFIGDIRPDIMNYFVQNKVFKMTRMFDYQAICQKEPPAPRKKSAASYMHNAFKGILTNMVKIVQWAITILLTNISGIESGPLYQSIKQETLAYEKIEIKKTFPTPCDQEMWIFTLEKNFNVTPMRPNSNTKFECPWPYVIYKIPESNLLFLAINGDCKLNTANIFTKNPTPKEIEYDSLYNMVLPCYIANKNNYSRHIYTKCYNRNDRENELNQNPINCGNTWGETY